MKEISIFVDESGDFGEYSKHSPYYIISMVFHDQEHSIADEVKKLDRELSLIGYDNHCIHAGPIIRQEGDYANTCISERRKVLGRMMTFVKNSNIRFKSFFIEKKNIESKIDVIGNLSKQIAEFIKNNYSELLSYDKVKVYCDNGQTEVTKILSSVLNALLSDVEFRKVYPSDYKLFQVNSLLEQTKNKDYIITTSFNRNGFIFEK